MKGGEFFYALSKRAILSSFNSSTMDTLRLVLTMVNLSQGGSITAQNPAGIRGTANAIYRQYGEPLIGEAGEELSTITDRSDMW